MEVKEKGKHGRGLALPHTCLNTRPIQKQYTPYPFKFYDDVSFYAVD